jgi:hypothetical protein
MNRYSKAGFADRLSDAADGKKVQLERAARVRSVADTPAAVERRTAREAISVARDARIAERTATKLERPRPGPDRAYPALSPAV